MEVKLDKNKEKEIEAAVFRKMVKHFQEHTDIQNIDVMNVAGFCRNCLSRWYEESSVEVGEKMSKDDAREVIYGMPYAEWKEKHQN
tara:strand:- start:144 stop:401 length:258 start_codon:yes stop_codon:yes gene_type:complete